MSEHEQGHEPTGEIDDATEQALESDDSGAAAAGDYDPAQGSPSSPAPSPEGDAEDVLVEDVPSQSEDPERR